MVIRYCQAVRAPEARVSTIALRGLSPLKRSIEEPDAGPIPANACAESELVEQFLSQVAARKHKPEIPELVSAIEFLRKTATDH